MILQSPLAPTRLKNELERDRDCACPSLADALDALAESWVRAASVQHARAYELRAKPVVANGHYKRICRRCGKVFAPYWSERFKRASTSCAVCTWETLEGLVSQGDL